MKCIGIKELGKSDHVIIFVGVKWFCYHHVYHPVMCTTLEFEEGGSSSLFLTMDINYFIEFSEGSIQLNYSLAKNVL